MTAIIAAELQPKQTFVFSSSFVNALTFKINTKFCFKSYNQDSFSSSSQWFDALLRGSYPPDWPRVWSPGQPLASKLIWSQGKHNLWLCLKLKRKLVGRPLGLDDFFICRFLPENVYYLYWVSNQFHNPSVVFSVRSSGRYEEEYHLGTPGGSVG